VERHDIDDELSTTGAQELLASTSAAPRFLQEPAGGRDRDESVDSGV
jgi:hypothetical protein